MKKEWILWNALQEPERITKDERMEQIKWKSYYWCYKVILPFTMGLSVIWPSIRSLAQMFLAKGIMQETLFPLLILGISLFIESGRFLYSCYYGNQELYDRGKGKGNFLAWCFCVGFYTYMVFRVTYGFKHPLPWGMAVFGMLLFIFVSHLSYLHYALITDEETEEKGRKSERWIPIVCTVILVLYYVLIVAASLHFWNKENQLPPAMTEEHRQMLEAVQRGIDNYHYLESYKMSYTFETDMEPVPSMENGDLLHANYLVSEGECYTQALDPENKDSIVKEYYRKDAEEFEWYMAHNGAWISEQDWVQKWAENPDEPTFWNTQPICGLWDIPPKAVESITKEYQAGNTCYTIHYNEKYEPVAGSLKESKEIEQAAATERYTINEYGVLIGYEHTEQGILKTTGEPRTMRRTFTILSADKEAIQSEIRRLKNQYTD